MSYFPTKSSGFTAFSSLMGSPYGSDDRRNEAFSVCDVHDASTSTIGPLYRHTLRRIVSAYRPHTLPQYSPFSSAYLL